MKNYNAKVKVSLCGHCYSLLGKEELKQKNCMYCGRKLEVRVYLSRTEWTSRCKRFRNAIGNDPKITKLVDEILTKGTLED